MFKCLVLTINISLAVCSTSYAGVYSSIDTREETRFDRDYAVFGKVLDLLSTISAPKPATNPPIRQRYVLIESFALTGEIKLDTVEQKINYSTMLIRRDRALEAVRFLTQVYEENRNNFLVLSQYSTAHFLTANRDFEGHAVVYMKKSLEKWPKAWGELNDDQKKFLRSMGWHDDADFDRYRRCEEHLQRLMVHRLNEKKLRDKKQETEDVLDPIFVTAKNQPIRFRNEKGEYQAAQIAAAEKELLRKDFVEDVMQLLIWMPNDERLLWLLAEALNASAMESTPNSQDRHRAVHSANQIFQRLLNFKTPAKYGQKEMRSHHEVLQAYVDANPLNDFVLPPIDDGNDKNEASLQWWRTVAVTFVLGAVFGMFALWQFQELRRRRQARA